MASYVARPRGSANCKSLGVNKHEKNSSTVPASFIPPKGRRRDLGL